MAKWVECKPLGGPEGTTILVNLEQVVSLSGNDRSTVVRYAGHLDSEFVVAGSPRDILQKKAIALDA